MDMKRVTLSHSATGRLLAALYYLSTLVVMCVLVAAVVFGAFVAHSVAPFGPVLDYASHRQLAVALCVLAAIGALVCAVSVRVLMAEIRSVFILMVVAQCVLVVCLLVSASLSHMVFKQVEAMPLRQKLLVAQHQFYGMADERGAAVTHGLDYMQRTFECCGVESTLRSTTRRPGYDWASTLWVQSMKAVSEYRVALSTATGPSAAGQSAAVDLHPTLALLAPVNVTHVQLRPESCCRARPGRPDEYLDLHLCLHDSGADLRFEAAVHTQACAAPLRRYVLESVRLVGLFTYITAILSTLPPIVGGIYIGVVHK